MIGEVWRVWPGKNYGSFRGMVLCFVKIDRQLRGLMGRDLALHSSRTLNRNDIYLHNSHTSGICPR